MIATRLSSALRGFGREVQNETEARPLAQLLGGKHLPLAPALDADRHEIATSDAGTISYYADTSASGRPLVLLHGIHAAASAYDMRPLFDSYRGQRPVYALDLPGFGFSERAARPYAPDTYVHAIEHLLRNVALSQGADVIALSLSAEYAAKVAVEMPELVHSLVLISPTGFGAPEEKNRLERFGRTGDRRAAQWLSSFAPSRLFYELLVSKPSLRWFLRRSFEGRLDEGMLAYAHATSHQDGAYHAPITFAAGGLFPAGNALETYARVHAPMLVLFDQDAYTGFGALDAFVANHDNVEARRISHTRGLPHFEAPQQTAEALRVFYQATEARGERGPDATLGRRRIIGLA